MAMVLEDAGFVVEKTTDGREALAMIRKRRPSVVVLDLIMPEISGWEVYEALRKDQRTKNIPVVITSADRDILAQSRRLGATAQVNKPFQLDELVRAVGNCIPLASQQKRSGTQPMRGVA
jgi:CheY-like chemotaxis protein